MTTDSKRTSGTVRVLASASAALSLLGLGGCATTSMLSGDDLQNTRLCTDFDTARQRAASLPVGTDKAAVYAAFGLQDEKPLRALNKEDLNRTLYGTSTLSIPFEQRVEAQGFLNSLQGYSLTCQNVHSHRHIGWTGTQLTKTGSDYTLTFIFDRAKNTLYDPVQVSGAPVDQKSNNGYLQGFSPGDTVMRAVTRF
jgi:hypothetical protein